jgi:hypothetical protein
MFKRKVTLTHPHNSSLWGIPAEGVPHKIIWVRENRRFFKPPKVPVPHPSPLYLFLTTLLGCLLASCLYHFVYFFTTRTCVLSAFHTQRTMHHTAPTSSYSPSLHLHRLNPPSSLFTQWPWAPTCITRRAQKWCHPCAREMNELSSWRPREEQRRLQWQGPTRCR